MSTNAEGMSNALIEAMCVGLPVISTDVCGAKELLCNPESGLIVPVGDTESLTEALRKIMSNNELMQQMAERNLAKAEMFKQDRIVDQWETLIRRVVSRYNANN
jgi:glycosyltransferase involved in cell wall biosynthesis